VCVCVCVCVRVSLYLLDSDGSEQVPLQVSRYDHPSQLSDFHRL